MTGIFEKKATTCTYHILVLAIVLSSMFILAVGCTDSPKKNGSTNGKSGTPLKEEHPLIGTWVSRESPDKEFIFTEDTVTYKEHGYSILLEETGKYKLDRDGNIEWSITWYSGGTTRWKGKLEDDEITVEYTNSWDDSQGKDILTRTQEAQ